MKSSFIYMMTIFQLMITNVISIEDTDIFYPQLLRVKVPVRPPSISSIQIFNKLRSKVTNSFGAERRMFFPLNRLILSMVAPRLMRFQFDMMLHSIISELVKKVVIPIMGSISGIDDRGRPPLLSTLFSQLSPTTQSPSPAFDMKQMIANAQNAIQQQGLTLQNAIRMNGQPSTATSPLSMANINQLNNEQMSLLQNSLNPLQLANFANLPINDLVQQTSQSIQLNPQKSKYLQMPVIKSMDSLLANGQPLHLNQMTFMPNTQSNPISGETSLQKHEKSNLMQQKWPTKLKSSISAKPKKQVVKMVPQYQVEYVQSNDSYIEEESMSETPKTESDSHEYQLSYVDTVVPSYGNQLSSEQIKHYSLKEVEEQVSTSQSTTDNDKTNQEIIEEIERASRWNDILVNMDKYNDKRRFMPYSK